MSFLPIDRAMSQAFRTSKIRGVRLAIVVDNKDGADNPGYRVKVKLPWLNEQETSFWARIAVPMGGPGRGTYMLPDINDQVLVVFEHGDINRPIVIGGLWSKKQEPVEVNQSGKNNTKLIKSRCGHRIIFDDKEGAEKITIVDKTKKNKIVFDSVNKIVKIESDGDIEVIAKTNVIMHSNALKIGTTEGLIGKGKSLLAHSAKTFGLKATSWITIGGGNATINTSNAAACSMSGSGTGELGAAAAEKPKDQVAERNRGVGVGGGNADHRGRHGDKAGGSHAILPPLPGGGSVDGDRPDAPTTGTISGRVTELGRPGIAVSGVTVKLNSGRIATTDADGNYSFSGLAPASYSVTTSKAGFVDPVPTSTSAVVAAGQTSTADFQLTRVVLEIVNPAGTVLTGAQRRVVGEPIQLTLRTNPVGLKLTNIQWAIPGNTVKSYTQSSAAGTRTLLAPADLKSATIQFYWLEALIAGNIQVTATVGSANLRTQILYDALAPTDISFTGKMIPPTVGPHFADPSGKTWISLQNAAGVPDQAGIQWNATATAPSLAIGEGQIAITQKINVIYTRKYKGKLQRLSTGGMVIDDAVRIQYGGPQPIVAGRTATLHGPNYADSPGIPLVDGVSEQSCRGEFSTYFMYQSSTPHSIWVTLARLDWMWSATATAVPPPGSGWTLGSLNLAPASATTVTAAITAELPEWKGNLKQHDIWR